jgi:8-hydroxy-5-deazaflavin:NADPH oxidoreductase
MNAAATTAELTIAILGGTGDLGSGLAKMWSAAGYPVIIGSRAADKAVAAAREIGNGVRGSDNVDAAASADVIVIAVPFASHKETLEAIREPSRGKIVIDAVVPLVPPKVSVVQLPQEGSAAKIAQGILGADVRLTSAFHNVGAAKLHHGRKAECDVLVFSDDPDARKVVIELASHVAQRALDGGALANSAAAEAMTSILIDINRKYKASGAGIRITGLPS